MFPHRKPLCIIWLCWFYWVFSLLILAVTWQPSTDLFLLFLYKIHFLCVSKGKTHFCEDSGRYLSYRITEKEHSFPCQVNNWFNWVGNDGYELKGAVFWMLHLLYGLGVVATLLTLWVGCIPLPMYLKTWVSFKCHQLGCRFFNVSALKTHQIYSQWRLILLLLCPKYIIT